MTAAERRAAVADPCTKQRRAPGKKKKKKKKKQMVYRHGWLEGRSGDVDNRFNAAYGRRYYDRPVSSYG